MTARSNEDTPPRILDATENALYYADADGYLREVQARPNGDNSFPSTGKILVAPLWFSSVVEGNGVPVIMDGPIYNASTATQSISATTAYLTGSALPAPPSYIKAGSCFRWTVVATKTAAG